MEIEKSPAGMREMDQSGRMETGKPALARLSTRNLKQVLEAARAAWPLPETPLKETAVFRGRLARSQSPLSRDVVDYLLLDWLNSLIIIGLKTQRMYYNHCKIETNTLRAALACLAQDFRQHAAELEAWSLLYFRYVRVDLGLSWEQLAEATACTARTLRRRQQRGVRRLLYRIIAEETAAYGLGLLPTVQIEIGAKDKGERYGEDIGGPAPGTAGAYYPVIEALS